MTTTRGWALAAGVAGVIANVLLVLFFAIDQPWQPQPHGTGWLGPANDVVVVVQFAALAGLAVALRRGAAFGVPAMVSVIVLQLLLITGVLPFDVQVLLGTVPFTVVLGWLLVVSRRAGLSPASARFGTAVAVTCFLGLAGVLGSLPLQPDSVVLWIGLGIAAVGWLGFGAWPLTLKEER